MAGGAADYHDQARRSLDVAIGFAFAIGLILSILWFVLHAQVSAVVIGFGQTVLQFFGATNPQALIEAAYLARFDPAQASFLDVVNICGLTLSFVSRWLAVSLLAGGMWLYFSSLYRRYVGAVDLRGLFHCNAAAYPSIAPAVKANLGPSYRANGPWASMMQLTEPEAGEFMTERPAQWPVGFGESMRVLVPDEKGRLHISQPRLLEVLMEQLGPEYRGPKELRREFPLTKPEFGLLTAFAALCESDKAGYELLDRMAGNFREPTPLRQLLSRDPFRITVVAFVDIHGADKLLASHMRIIERMAQRHAYLRTVLMGLLELAGQRGVIEPARFLWLKPAEYWRRPRCEWDKPFCRSTWYSLHAVGMQGCSVEALGTWHHYQLEKAAGQALWVSVDPKRRLEHFASAIAAYEQSAEHRLAVATKAANQVAADI